MNNKINLKSKKPKVVVSIEARMSSSRLPGKVLADINGTPALTHLLHRLRSCKTIDDIVLATTINNADDELENWAKINGVHCYRGSENDVLLRVLKANQSINAEVIVEITGDCVFTDPNIIDMGVNTFLANDCDIVTNCELHSAPPGLYVQVFSYDALENIEKNIKDGAVREHVSLYFYEHPELYKIIHLFTPPQWDLPKDSRIYLDYPEDLDFLIKISEKLEPKFGFNFNAEQIVELLNNEPELLEINRNCTNIPVRE
jgi:spore coat polysaccharide biosynthesis protein SpsF